MPSTHCRVIFCRFGSVQIYIINIVFNIIYFSPANHDSIEPAFGGIGSTITIRGNNFSYNAIENIVFFNG